MPSRPTLRILDETDHWIVVAKPPRLLVHRNAHHPRAEACLQCVRDQIGHRVYPIHRLDFQTSGCLLFAKTRSWAGPLQQALRDGQKTYVAFVRGHYSHDAVVTVTTPMKDDKGILKDAESRVEWLGRSHDPRCSLLRVEPKTGRFHQVRRHVRDLHHPCIGDSEHGDSKINRWWRENTPANRLGLHCLRLTIPLEHGPSIDVECPLFEDHFALFSTMPWWPEAISAEPGLAAPPLPLLAPRSSDEE
ncbi:MAG: pseudouridine synthase [Myxococcota bacterium]|nr:pseudouridine synthase [Myxococcota bacterium]MEC9390321.1 pseudouridine synthase [Myxococcota bacterium]